MSEQKHHEDQMSFGERALNHFFNYQTLKIVNINDKYIGLLNRAIQVVILGYVIG